MKLLSLKIYKADTCGGLLDGLVVSFRGDGVDANVFDPICLIGPNGSGKSQLLQIIAEIFQAAFHEYLPSEERGTPNSALEFEIEYLIKAQKTHKHFTHVRISKKEEDGRKAKMSVDIYKAGAWHELPVSEDVGALLPEKVVGYTSGGNETLSLPFLSSRAGYAKEVSTNALSEQDRSKLICDPRMLLIDYGTNLEVLVANLLLNPEEVRLKLLQEPSLKNLRSFRCVVQLKPSPGPTKGVKLTEELEVYIQHLKNCASCFDYDEGNDSWVFDFFVSPGTHAAFLNYWPDGALQLYSCFHKLAMLNDLIIPKKAREVFERSVKSRRFASRLPEPFDDHKVFRFERVEFVSSKSGQTVDYVSLSDGEHQLAQLLGTACMVSFPNVLFLLDEPESHFNPKWRVEFIKKLQNMPTAVGARSDISASSQQECLITTHSPFVPSDMQRENVLIFKKPDATKIEIRRPEIQTYGSRFDAILAECFDINPPISALPRDEAAELLVSGDKEKISAAIAGMGESSVRMKLAVKLSQLEGDS